MCTCPGASAKPVPLPLKDLDLGISQVAADDVSDPSPVVVQLEVASVLSHNLLEFLPNKPSNKHFTSCMELLIAAEASTIKLRLIWRSLTACDGVVKPLTMMLTPVNRFETARPVASPYAMATALC